MKGKVTALFAVLVLSLAATGIAYAAWTAQLNISGTVYTGTFDMTISNPAYDYPIVPGVGGTMTVTVVGDTLTTVITNAYPGRTGWVDIKLKNTGTVPAKVTGITFTQMAWPYFDDISWTFGGWVPSIGDVILPGKDLTFTISFTVLPEAVPDGTYTYSVVFDFGLP
jgi:hypothetical protein